MSGRIPREFLDDLIIRVDIVDLIDSHLPLKKSGSNYVARCPFHTEKTPSFSVSRNKQFYHCFGCGASGNAISFIMDYNHLDFVEAVEDLAAFAGVEVRREAQLSTEPHFRKKQDFTAMLDLLRHVAGYYCEQMRRHKDSRKAVAYLKGRGVNGEVARDFMLGYAPDLWNELEKKFNPNLLLSAGLSVKKDSGSGYDRFRGRIMFPIRNRRGQVVGFGGRVLDDSVPKYLNSPESEVFHKGNEVYGLYELLEKLNKPVRILVVEGYMDVIALSQFGIGYAVATLGTAISKQQVELLFRVTAEIVLCFDGDKAGQQAAWRAIDASLPCLRDGRQVRIMLLPQGADPDSHVRSIGADQFELEVAKAETLSNFFFDHLRSGLQLDNPEGGAGLVEKALPYLKKLPNGVFQDLMVNKLQELSRVKEVDVFQQQQGKVKRDKSSGKRQTVSAMRTAIALLLQYPELVEVAQKKVLECVEPDVPGFALLCKIIQRISASPNLAMAALIEDFRGTPEEKQVQLLLQQEIITPEKGVEVELSGALDKVIGQAQELRLGKILAKVNECGLSGLDVQERELLARGSK
jgi:DNA primase